MRRAQMEIFGMVFIVLLIFVGFFIYISFGRLDTPPDSPQSEFVSTQMASNFIDAILRVTTNCSNQDLGYVIAACEDPTASAGSLICDNGNDPCQEAQDILVMALQETLGAMDYDYQLSFKVRRGGSFEMAENFPIPDEPLTCVEKVKPGVYPFQSHLTRNMLELRLDICR